MSIMAGGRMRPPTKASLSSSLMFVLMAIALNLWADSVPSLANIAKVEIYYYGWDVLTRSRISLDTIRKNPKIATVIHDKFEISEFVRWLRISDMSQQPDRLSGMSATEDPRLVIDFFDLKNRRVTYYASRFRFLSEDSRKSRPIDDTFRRRFTFAENGS